MRDPGRQGCPEALKRSPSPFKDTLSLPETRPLASLQPACQVLWGLKGGADRWRWQCVLCKHRQAASYPVGSSHDTRGLSCESDPGEERRKRRGQQGERETPVTLSLGNARDGRGTALYGYCRGRQPAWWDTWDRCPAEAGPRTDTDDQVTVGCGGHKPTGTDGSSNQGPNLVATIHDPPALWLVT